MSDWLRPLAPLGYAVGAILLIDQLMYLVAEGPYDLSADLGRFRLAILLGSRLSALALGFLLLGASAVLLGHRRIVKYWVVLVWLVALAAAVMVPVAITASLDAPVIPAPGQPGLVDTKAEPTRLSVILTGLMGLFALATLAIAVRATSRGAPAPSP